MVESTLQTMQKFQAKCRIKCSCLKKEPVMFVCRAPDCTLKQPLYCLGCLTEGDHVHAPNVKIEALLKSADQQWATKKISLDELVKAASLRYGQLKPVIEHFEEERKAFGIQLGANMVLDFALLLETASRFAQLFLEIEDSLEKCDLLEILARDKDFKECVDIIDKLEYLGQLSERDILIQYL